MRFIDLLPKGQRGIGRPTVSLSSDLETNVGVGRFPAFVSSLVPARPAVVVDFVQPERQRSRRCLRPRILKEPGFEMGTEAVAFSATLLTAGLGVAAFSSGSSSPSSSPSTGIATKKLSA